MRIISGVKAMNDLGLLDWHLLHVGWKQEFVEQDEIVTFAEEWLLANPNEDRLPILLLVDEENLDTRDIDRFLLELDPIDTCESDLLKWRLATLVALSETNLEWDSAVDELELIRVRFDSPLDMAMCTRYCPSKEAIRAGLASSDDRFVDPLDAMHDVIKKLKCALSIQPDPAQ